MVVIFIDSISNIREQTNKTGCMPIWSDHYLCFLCYSPNTYLSVLLISVPINVCPDYYLSPNYYLSRLLGLKSLQFIKIACYFYLWNRHPVIIIFKADLNVKPWPIYQQLSRLRIPLCLQCIADILLRFTSIT